MPKHKFGRPKKHDLDQKVVGTFLSGLGFEIEFITQEWRHLLAFGKYQGKDAVFKLASTQVTSPRTQNEFYWNEAVHLVHNSDHQNFTVPKNYDSGYFGKLFYFIAERFLEEPFVGRNSNDISKVISRIPQIAKATYELENLPIPPDCAFAQPKKTKRQKQIPVGHKLLQATTEWANQVPRNLDTFLKIIEKSKDNLKTCIGHGDFVIRQMYDVNGKIGLIDGEHAGYRGPLYYDIAQFYIRLRNDYNAKDLAQEYLRKFSNLLLPPDKQTFWEELKPVLIQRYIGDLWGAAKNPDKLNELELLGKEILDNSIV
jgi:hypothetical protein